MTESSIWVLLAPSAVALVVLAVTQGRAELDQRRRDRKDREDRAAEDRRKDRERLHDKKADAYIAFLDAASKLMSAAAADVFMFSEHSLPTPGPWLSEETRALLATLRDSYFALAVWAQQDIRAAAATLLAQYALGEYDYERFRKSLQSIEQRTGRLGEAFRVDLGVLPLADDERDGVIRAALSPKGRGAPTKP